MDFEAEYLVRRVELRRQVDDLIEQLQVVLELLSLRQLPRQHLLVNYRTVYATATIIKSINQSNCQLLLPLFGLRQ